MVIVLFPEEARIIPTEVKNNATAKMIKTIFFMPSPPLFI